MRTSLYRPHIGIILGMFSGRYTRHKTGIFSGSQYELSHTPKKFVLRPIRHHLPLFSHPCPISRSLSHVHARRNFPNFFRKIFAEFAPSRRNPQNSANPPLFSKLSFMLPLAEIFPKNFFQKISRLSPNAIPS